VKLRVFITSICAFLFSCGIENEEVKNKKESVLFFEEEFNKETLNTSIWNYDLGDGCPKMCGWGNNELQSYKRFIRKIILNFNMELLR